MEPRKIKDVTVAGISLVTKEYTPAVQKAENKYAIFKMQAPAWMQKLADFFWLSKIGEEKIDKAIKSLEKLQELAKHQ